MKKPEYQLKSVDDLRVRGEGLLSITLKYLYCQEYSSLNAQVNSLWWNTFLLKFAY